MANSCQQVSETTRFLHVGFYCTTVVTIRSSVPPKHHASYVLSRAAALQTRVLRQPMRGKNKEVNLSVSTDRYSFKTVSNNSSVYHNISSPYRFTHVFLSNFLIILCYFGNIVCRLWTISIILVPCLKTVLKL